MGILTKQRFLCRFWARLLILLVLNLELQRTSNLTYIWHILICILQPVQFSRMKGILVCFSQYPIDCRNCCFLKRMEHYPYQGNIIIDYPMFDGTQGFLMFDVFFQPTSVTAELERRRLVGGQQSLSNGHGHVSLDSLACLWCQKCPRCWLNHKKIDPQDGFVKNYRALPIPSNSNGISTF